MITVNSVPACTANICLSNAEVESLLERYTKVRVLFRCHSHQFTPPYVTIVTVSRYITSRDSSIFYNICFQTTSFASILRYLLLFMISGSFGEGHTLVLGLGTLIVKMSVHCYKIKLIVQ